MGPDMRRLWFFITVFLCIACTNTSATQIDARYTENIKLSATVSPFKQKLHKIEYCGDYLCLIDNTPFFGTDGKLPSQQLDKITLSINGQSVVLNTKGMFNPTLTPSTITNRIQVTHFWGNVYKVKGEFSDGAGAYLAEWLIVKNQALRTAIGNKEGLSDLLSD